MLMMPFVGFLVGHTQAKYLVAIGMLIEAAAMWHLSNLSLDASYRDFDVGADLSGFGIGVFVCADHDSFVCRCADEQEQRSVGDDQSDAQPWRRIWNIAVQTWPATCPAIPPSAFVGTRGPYRMAISLISRNLQNALSAGGSAISDSSEQAMAVLYKLVQRQAGILSYLDVFRRMAWCALIALPLVLLLKRVKPGEAHAGH